ncbi:T9SS type B sorting domain-containing protein [Flavobacterium sp.]|uniref:T9SS type B sorting domain-containing protein n=1 Tax=Flavobacterium sp. TaxID=239 RepID=UPI00391D79A8
MSVQGPGLQEITPPSCDSQENNSLWIKVTIKTDGTLGFLITPQESNLMVDFDFFVFGPEVTCQSLGSPIRCSTTNPILAGLPNNLTGMIETELDWNEGPAQFGNGYVEWLEVLEGETYYIVVDRAAGNGNFSLEWTGTATFSEPPVVNESTSGALNIVLCDSDAIDDGSTAIDLTQSGTLAVGNQNNIVVTYHLTENEATINSNAIPNPTSFINTVNPQTIFIRLENEVSGCFTLSAFSVSVTPFSLPDLIDLEECDNDNDGFVVFDLSQISDLFITDPNFTISFHPSDNDAVTLPQSYTNQLPFGNEVLWAKIYNAAEGCTVYKPFNLIINRTPVAVPSQITQCDFELFPDGLTTFNLNQATTNLTNGDSSVLTQFYLNATDALNSQNEQNTIFNNTVNPQILTVKIINPLTGCYSLTTLTLNANLNPTTIVNLQSCDDNAADGIATFNLTDAGFETNGNSVSYYYNTNDALMEQNQITTNQFSEQNIYARVENGNDCIGIHIVQLEVSAIPQATIEAEGILCANLPNQTITLQTEINNPGNYTFYWSPNGETSPTIMVSQAGDYTVTITNALTSCFTSVTVQLEASEAPILETIEVIDLVENNSITIIVSGSGDYWFSLDNGNYQQSNFFDGVVPGQHIVSIKDMNGCGVIYQTVFVLGIPSYFTPNGDGYHDYWQVKGLDINTNSNSKIYIFNRFGKLLKQISAVGEGWDGNYNGRQMPSDDYWYSIQLDDGRNVKGHFALKR